jgi:phosphatidylserine decarboxylase
MRVHYSRGQALRRRGQPADVWRAVTGQSVAPRRGEQDMAKSLHEWLDSDVAGCREESVSWLSAHYFFRDPPRPTFSDVSCFFSPADGVILYQREVAPEECLVEIKGRSYSVRDAIRDPGYDRRCLVIGIFMTFYDVHINRIPYPGRLSWRQVEALDTYNHPMLDVEKALLERLHVPPRPDDYLHHNQRVVNRIASAQLGESYYVVQVADYDVDRVTPFDLGQNRPVQQGQRFSAIRYGSQTDLIVPLSERYELEAVHSPGNHVEAGVDRIVTVTFTDSGHATMN